MKKLLALMALVAFATGSAFAGCGKTVTDDGTLKAYDKENKALTIETAEGKTVSRTLTPSSTGAADVEKLVGKKVTVVSEHGKVQSVAPGKS